MERLDRDREVVHRIRQDGRNMNRNVIAASEGGRVAGVAIQEDRDAIDVSGILDDRMDPIGRHGIDQPDTLITRERMARPLDRLSGLGDPG